MAARKKRPFRRIHDSATLPPLPTDMLDEIAALGCAVGNKKDL